MMREITKKKRNRDLLMWMPLVEILLSLLVSEDSQKVLSAQIQKTGGQSPGREIAVELAQSDIFPTSLLISEKPSCKEHCQDDETEQIAYQLLVGVLGNGIVLYHSKREVGPLFQGFLTCIFLYGFLMERIGRL